MAPDGAGLIGAITALAFMLLPVASKLIADVGGEISDELDGGRTGAGLTRHLDRRFAARRGGEGAMREAEIRQLLEARAYVRRRGGETPLDVEAELTRIMAGGDAAAEDPGS